MLKEVIKDVKMKIPPPRNWSGISRSARGLALDELVL